MPIRRSAEGFVATVDKMNGVLPSSPSPNMLDV
jgi:hypothetical protein